MGKNRFEVVSTEGNDLTHLAQVVVDTETGVNYLFFKSGHGAGVTPLLDADGKPVITKKAE